MPTPAQPSTRTVVQRPPDASAVDTGTYRALVIGVADYQYHTSLEQPVADAQRFQQLLLRHYTFDPKAVHFLENPTREQLLGGLDAIEQELEEADSLLVFFAGHGHWDERRQQGYWLPSDAKIRSRSAWISNATLQEYLRAFVCQHVLVVADSCFSGSLLMRRSAMADADKDIQVLYSSKSRKAISSGVKEEVPDQSVFFHQLFQFLTKNKESFLSASALFAGIRNDIIINSPTNQKPQFGAVDDTGDEGGDFIFIKKGTATQLSLEKPSPYEFLLKNPQKRKRLEALRQQLDLEIPVKTLSQNLLIATWNIRKLGGNDYGGRTREALAYLATIIERFDVVAIQEIYGNFQVLDDLKSFLGPHWNYFFSDTSIGLGGEDYRLGFFYDTRKVQQGGIASDLLLPSQRKRGEDGRFRWEPATQLLRPPLNVGFRIGNRRIVFCNVHLVFGSRQRKAERLRELTAILDFWQWRTSRHNAWTKNVVLLGNFQTKNRQEKEIHLLQESLFEVVDALRVASNPEQTRYYNQFAFHLPSSDFTVTGRGGAFNFFQSVFREGDFAHYADQLSALLDKQQQLTFTDTNGTSRTFRSKGFFYKKFWRQSQLSDNLPLWAELAVDDSDNLYL